MKQKQNNSRREKILEELLVYKEELPNLAINVGLQARGWNRLGQIDLIENRLIVVDFN